MTNRRRAWAALAAGVTIVLAVSACQVDGSAQPNPAAVAALSSSAASSAAASGPATSAPATSAPATSLPASTGLESPISTPDPSSPATSAPGSSTTIEDRSTSVGPSSGVAPSSSASGPTLVIADDGYAASVVVASVWAQALVAKGFRVGIRTIDTEAAQVAAIKGGQIDLAVQYNTQLLRYLDNGNDAVTQSDVDAAIAQKLPAGLSVLKSTAAKDDAILAVSSATASKYGLHSISDLSGHVGDLTLLVPGTDATDFARGLTRYYGLTFATTKPADWGGAATIAGIKSSAAVGPMASSQWQIDADKFVTLTDPEHLFYVENFIPLVGGRIAPAMRTTLNTVSAKLSLAAVRGLRKAYSAGGAPSDIADAWLASVGLH